MEMKQALQAELDACKKELAHCKAAPAAAAKQVTAERAEAFRQVELLQAELRECNFKRAQHRREASDTKADLYHLRQTELTLREKLADVSKQLTAAHTKEAARLRGEARDQRTSDRASAAASLLLAAAELRETQAVEDAKTAREEAEFSRKEMAQLEEKVRATESDHLATQTALNTASHQAMLLQRRLERALSKLDDAPRTLPSSRTADEWAALSRDCLLYTSDAADDTPCVDLG
eukprot:5443110-Pleurochrysis_carterae.AAC.1